MKRLDFALLAGAAAFALSQPAAAQHEMMPGMQMPGMKMPAPKKKAAPVKKKTAPKKAAGKAGASKKAPAKKVASKKAAPKKPAAKRPQPGHDMSSMPGMEMPAGQDMSTVPQQQGQMPAGHDMSTMPGMQTPENPPQPQSQMPPGHDMSTMPGAPSQPMPGHDMGAMTAPAAVAEGTSLPAGNAPPPPVPTDHAADAFYGSEASEMGRHHLQTFHGGQKLFQVLNNIAEYRRGGGRDGYGWDSEGWYGGDINRFWFKSEGEGQFGGPLESAEVQGLYSRAIDPYFNLQGGLRYDFKPNPSRVYATIGVEGLAPNFFDVEGALFLSNKGEVMARASGWYDQRITQRLILQPRVELDFAAQNSRAIGVGAGLSKTEIGVRLRYDIRREFAPYVGVQYQRAFGRTARYLRDEGEDAGGWEFLAGVRTWF